MTRFSVVAFLLVLAGAGNLHAQEPDTTLMRVLGAAQRSGQFVRLATAPEVAGRITTITPELVRVPGNAIPLRDIRTVEFRSTHGGGMATGVFVGTVAATLATVSLAAPFTGLNPRIVIGSAVLGFMVGGPIGGMAGRVLAPPDITWNVVWPDESRDD